MSGENMADLSHEISIERILRRYAEYRSNLDELKKIEDAYHLAEDVHSGQKRKTKHAFIVHPLSVAYILADLELDWEVICAALLHDTIEDTSLTPDILIDRFGSGVANLVDSLTKIKKAFYAISEEDSQLVEIESIRKIIIGATQDVRVILIKLADRWDNVKTLNALSPERGKRFAEETMAIYAPFADKLGLSIIRKEMEDLCFSYLQPKKQAKFSRRLLSAKNFLQPDVNDLKKMIGDVLADAQMNCKVYEEYQTPFGFYFRSRQKLRPQIVDIIILTHTARDCYQVLGIVHENFTPVSGSNIKDFIAVPRSNGYQALHTTILFRENVFPVFIRSHEMDRVARYGVLAKTEGNHGEGFQRWLLSLKELVNEADSSSFFKNIQDVAKEDIIYVCTPRGDYLGFPPNASILDFAYRIHTDLGHHCASAFMDDQPAGIYEELRDGSMIEVISSPDVHPQAEWLNKVKTPRARTAIREWLDNQKRQLSHQFGKKILAHEMRRFNLNLDELIGSEHFAGVLQKLGLDDTDDLCIKLGRGILTPRKVISHFVSNSDFKRFIARQTALLPRLLPFLFSQADSSEAYMITDVHDAFIKLSKCCNPLPGDEVIGILSVHHGLSVHRVDCKTVKVRAEDKDRVIKMRWQLDVPFKQFIHISIRADNRQEVPVKVLNALQAKNIPVCKFHVERLANETSIEMEIESSSAGQVDLVVQLIEKIKGVIKAQRI